MTILARLIFAFFSLCLSATTPADEQTRLSTSVRNSEKGLPIISGQTNLPDGTVLLITITCPSISYLGQDSVQVANGSFQSSQFSEKGMPIRVSNCTSETSMPPPSTQPQFVRERIGSRGEKLKGPLVHRDSKTGIAVRSTSRFSIKVRTASKPTSRAQPTSTVPPLTARHIDSSCPCSSSVYCVGPRGGRYCFTRSGSKSYR